MKEDGDREPTQATRNADRDEERAAATPEANRIRTGQTRKPLAWSKTHLKWKKIDPKPSGREKHTRQKHREQRLPAQTPPDTSRGLLKSPGKHTINGEFPSISYDEYRSYLPRHEIHSQEEGQPTQ